jgi:hypothetical protein
MSNTSDGARTLPETEQEIILLAERIEGLMREKEAMVIALEEAERFMDYFAEGRTGFQGPGTPKSCLAMIRGALALKKPAATGETGK